MESKTSRFKPQQQQSASTRGTPLFGPKPAAAAAATNSDSNSLASALGLSGASTEMPPPPPRLGRIFAAASNTQHVNEVQWPSSLQSQRPAPPRPAFGTAAAVGASAPFSQLQPLSDIMPSLPAAHDDSESTINISEHGMPASNNDASEVPEVPEAPEAPAEPSADPSLDVAMRMSTDWSVRRHV